jgi:DNA polymerase
VFHVHDEVIIDAPAGFGRADEVAAIMGEPIPWAQGLPLRAEGYETEFYRKD